MDTIRNEFFSLVRAGLWGIPPDTSLFNTDTDWESLHKISNRQALLGIVLDGIELLPADIHPPRPLYLKWCAEVLEIEDNNILVDKEVVNLFNLLENHGITPVLMKGQGVARNYRNPVRRAVGDIDIYIGKENYDKVNQLLSLDGKWDHNWEPRHSLFFWHNVIVENHKVMSVMFSPICSHRLQSRIKEWHSKGDFATVNINGKEINLPPIDFDAVYILQHAVTHLLEWGLGFRQICDWALLLHNKRNVLDKKAINKLLKKLGLTNAWKIFGALSVKFLGLPEEDLLLKIEAKDYKLADQLLEDIWENGNFGISGERIRERKKNPLLKLIYNYGHYIRRGLRLFKVAPQEVLWLPTAKFKYFVQSKNWKFSHKKKD